MRIGIEAQRIFRKKKHGMDNAALQVIKELQKIDARNDYFVFVAPGEDCCLEDTHNFHIIELGNSFYALWEQYSLPKIVKQLNIDLLHCTSNTAPLHCSVPIILTLHNIIFLEPRDRMNESIYQNLGWYYRKMVVPKILKKCKRIITVSNYEKNNIVNTLGIPEEKMAMIYNGYTDWFKPLQDIEFVYRKYIDNPNYFFFLGNTDPKKNTERTLIAYSRYLEKSDVKRKLLMADIDEQYLSYIIERNQIENIRNMIVIPGYIENKDLPYIYNNAFAFLYPSLRESFGIPLLEAMACGTPVITSNTSSMPEIGGPNAILINPENPDEITEKMLQLERDDEFYSRQEEVGLHQASLFSWRQTAEQLLRLYEEVYKEI